MLTYIGIAALVLVAGVLVYASTRPDSFRIERTILVDAPPEAAFARVNDFHRWTEWSPWEGIDPAMKRTYGGPPAGVGTTRSVCGEQISSSASPHTGARITMPGPPP